MGPVMSALNSMLRVDDRDMRLAVTMIRAHHDAINDSHSGMYVTAVPWSRMAHTGHPNFGTHWSVVERILDEAPVRRARELGIEFGMLDEIVAFESDPSSLYGLYGRECDVCERISEDLDDFWDGPVGTAHFFDDYSDAGAMPGGNNVNPALAFYRWGHNTGLGRNRHIRP
jgi:hypothetical protein